jgi:hypothetical protein
MMKISPGPFAPISLPRRKITPRSYSRRILTDAKARIMRKTIKKRIAGEIPVTRVMRVSPDPIFYQYQDLYLSLLALEENFNKNYRLIELLYQWKKYNPSGHYDLSTRPWNTESASNVNSSF